MSWDPQAVYAPKKRELIQRIHNHLVVLSNLYGIPLLSPFILISIGILLYDVESIGEIQVITYLGFDSLLLVISYMKDQRDRHLLQSYYMMNMSLPVTIRSAGHVIQF